MAKEKLVIIHQVAEKLLELLGIEATVAVAEDGQSGSAQVQIETAEQGVLIGYHGETLSAFQMILGIISSRQIGDWVKVVVNVGDYRQKREETLKRIALATAQKVQLSGQPVALIDLSPFERRVIHLALADHSEVETISEGEGKERKLVVQLRKTK